MTDRGWRYFGQQRPAFAIAPEPGQESVWDYPRPPGIVSDAREVVVCAHGVEIARTRGALRVLETASPPTFYLPWEDVARRHVEPAPGSSYCEWKGAARYWSIRVNGALLAAVAWSYPQPRPEFEAVAQCVSFYPGRVECYAGGERVLPQPGAFYGGWITSEIVGPFKGEPGSHGW